MERTNWHLTIAVAALAAVALFPVYWLFMSSVLPTSVLLSRNPPLLPPLEHVSLASYFEVLSRRPMIRWTLNSVAVTFGAAAIALTISTLAGYSLSRYRTRAQQTAGYLLLFSKLLPTSLLVVPFFIMFSTFGLLDSLPGLMLANAAVGVPFATWLMKGFFDAIPREIDQAAMIDGCNELQVLWHVVLPLARPGAAACAIYLAIVTWSDFVFARTLISTPDRWMLTVGLRSFFGEYLVDWSNLMAAGGLSLIPVLIMFLLVEPYLVRGMASGAVNQ